MGGSCGRLRGTGHDQPGFVGEGHELGAVARGELGQRSAHVRLRRGRADDELLGDLGVAHSGGDERHHLGLSGRQLGQLAGPGTVDVGESGQLVEEASRHRRRECGGATGDRAHGLDELGGGGVLEQESAHAGAQRAEHAIVDGGGHQDDDLDAVEGAVGREAPKRRRTLQTRKLAVDQQHGWARRALRQCEGLLGVGGLGDDGNVGLAVEQDAQAATYERLAVGDEDPDGRFESLIDEADGHGRIVHRRAWPVHTGPQDTGVHPPDAGCGIAARAFRVFPTALYGGRVPDEVRVVVGEDDVLMREGIVRLLAEAGFEVAGQAGDAEEFLRKALAHRPDVAVVDVRMPPGDEDDGLRAALELRRRRPETGVLVLSQYYEEEYALDLIGDSAEGVGYLLKERVGDVEAFTDAVARVAAGGSALDPEVVGRMLGRRRPKGALDRLSARDREVLAYLAEGKSNRGIAEALVISNAAVEKRITSIFTALGLEPEPTEHRRVLAALTYINDSRR